MVSRTTAPADKEIASDTFALCLGNNAMAGLRPAAR
jgi:hypothetical protein